MADARSSALRAVAQNPAVLLGNPALSGAEQYGDIMEPATASATKKLAAGLRAAVDAMGGPLSARMAAHGEQQKARMASGDYSPTPLTGESIDLADSVAGSLVGNIGMAAALRAYHGSPHRFDRFDIGKIGTGEGAQAYGHGLYFAEGENVAKSYAKELTRDFDNSFYLDGEPLRFREQGSEAREALRTINQFDGDFSKAAEWLETHARGPIDFNKSAASEVRRLQAAGLEHRPPAGALYTTRLDVEPEDLLDWDAPLSQQSEKVQKLAADALGLWTSDSPARQAYVREKLSGSGDWFYRKLVAEKGSHEAASAALREAGIPGIRYLDQGSRASGEGTRNFVIFDDKLIDITHIDGKPVTPAERAEVLAKHQDGLPDRKVKANAAD